MSRTIQGPLAGIRVLDLSTYVSGPYGCTLLADQGAEVIKIEPPSGDGLRSYPSTLRDESRAFLGVNRSKRGLVLNLKRPEGLALLLRFVREADVLVHNLRPSVPKRLGIDHDALSLINPRLIYCSVTGYGESGPMKDRAGHDHVFQAMTGMCSRRTESSVAMESLGDAVVDYYAAALVAAGVSSALYERERSGLGQQVGVSLLRSALTMQAARLVWAEDEPIDADRDVQVGGVTGIHPTGDGYLYIAVRTLQSWKALCEKTGLTGLADDKRFDNVLKRTRAAAGLVPQLHAALRMHSATEWEELLGDEVPCAASRRIHDMFDHPQVQAEGMIARVEHPKLGHYRALSRAICFGRTPGPLPFAAPTHGQHSRELLAELGLGDDDWGDLRSRGVSR